MHYVYLVATLAIIQFLFFGILVGSARAKYGVQAPATTGHEGFDRIFRVQMNTLEQLIAFLPALFMCALWWQPSYVAAVGAVYLVGRFIFWRSYVADPKTRSLGFALTVAPTLVLLLGVLVAVVRVVAKPSLG